LPVRRTLRRRIIGPLHAHLSSFCSVVPPRSEPESCAYEGADDNCPEEFQTPIESFAILQSAGPSYNLVIVQKGSRHVLDA
jgi:hypothetical protein